MKTGISVFVAAATYLLIAACSTPLKVTSDYDKTASFTGYKTFAMDTFRMSERISQLNVDRIVNAVKAEMLKKGFTEDKAAPDLKISVATILQDRKSVSANTNFYGYGGMYRPYAWGGGLGATGYTTYDVQNYKDGSLIIDVGDAQAGKLIWEGIGNKEIDGPIKDPDTSIPAAVATIMASFPPGK